MKEFAKHFLSAAVGCAIVYAAYHYGFCRGVKVNLGPAVAEKFAACAEKMADYENRILALEIQRQFSERSVK